MLLTIDKLVYGGDGLARLPADEHGRGKAVFVPFTLAGEQVEASIVEQKPGFARARLERVVAPSPQRVDPTCPYFLRCGGCQYQHTGYEHQLEIKAAILRETLARVAKLEWPGEIKTHASPPWNYRNRARLQVRTQPQFTLGFYAHGSHQVVAIDECPISAPLINKAIGALRGIGERGGLSPAIREVEVFAAADALLLEFYVGQNAIPEDGVIGVDGHALRRELPEMSGMALFAAAGGNEHEDQLVASSGADPKSRAPASLVYRAAGREYRVSPGSFFQTNRFLVDTMIKVVCDGQRGKLALDLYAGVGLFARALAESFDRVVAVEPSRFSSADLRRNVPPNTEVVSETTERYLARLSGRPDLVVVDPPRAGLGHKVTRTIAELSAPRMTYVSCDPATLARDLATLIGAGYRVERLHLLDLFPQTFHIETVAQLVK